MRTGGYWWVQAPWKDTKPSRIIQLPCESPTRWYPLVVYPSYPHFKNGVTPLEIPNPLDCSVAENTSHHFAPWTSVPPSVAAHWVSSASPDTTWGKHPTAMPAMPQMDVQTWGINHEKIGASTSVGSAGSPKWFIPWKIHLYMDDNWRDPPWLRKPPNDGQVLDVFGVPLFFRHNQREISSQYIPACTIKRPWNYDKTRWNMEVWKYGNEIPWNTQLSHYYLRILLLSHVCSLFFHGEYCIPGIPPSLVSDPPVRPGFWLRLPFASVFRSHPDQQTWRNHVLQAWNNRDVQKDL